MKKRKKRAKKGEPQTITKAVTHIGWKPIQGSSLPSTSLPGLSSACTAVRHPVLHHEVPNAFRAPCFRPLFRSGGIAWQFNRRRASPNRGATNRANAYQDYLDELAEYQEQKPDGDA